MWCRVACVLAALVPGLAGAQGTAGGPFTVIFENFLTAKSGQKGLVHRLSWIEAAYRVNDKIRLLGSFICIPRNTGTRNRLDEAYAQFDSGGPLLRVGRFRPKFGFGDWSELFYTPIIARPLVRGEQLNNLSLLRTDTGVEAEFAGGDLTFQVALVDVKNDDWQFVPQKLDHSVARVQWATSTLMVGANLLTKVSAGTQRNTIGGIDLRWSGENVIVRFEADKGFDTGDNGEGFYLDVFYRPFGLHRTQLGLRTEAFNDRAGEETRLATIGLRQILSQEMVLGVNYATGSDSALGRSSAGWSLQLMTAVRF